MHEILILGSLFVEMAHFKNIDSAYSTPIQNMADAFGTNQPKLKHLYAFRLGQSIVLVLLHAKND